MSDPISTVIEAVGSLVCVVDQDGRIVRFNRACEELSGWSAAEVQGRRFFDFLLVPDEVERVEAVMAGVQAGDFPSQSENHWVTRSGELRLISWRNDALLDEDGAVLNVIGTGVDITDEKRLERDLREAERRYRGLVEQLPAILYTAELGVDGGWHYTSPQIEATLGFTPEEWAADSGLWFLRIHPDDQERVRVYEESGFDSGDQYLIEYRVLARDGRVVWLRDEASIVRDDVSGRLLTHGFMLDISERMRLEDALRESEAHTRLIVDTALDAVVTIDADGVITGWNAQSEAIFGWSAAEALGRFLSDTIIPPGYREAHERGLRHFAETGEGPALNRRLEFMALRRSGEEFPVEVSISPARSGSGVLFSGFLRDISERKEAEEKLRDAEERYRMLVEQLPLAVYLDEINPEAPWIYLSPQIEAMLGYPVDEWLSKPETFFAVMHDEDKDRVHAELRHTLETGDPFTSEYRMISRDGRVVWIHDRGFALPDAEGSRRHLQGFMLDITARRQADDELMVANRKLQAYIGSSPLAIMTWDREGRVLSWNPAAERIFGWTEEEALGCFLPQVQEDAREEMLHYVERGFRGETWTDTEHVRQRKDGSLVDVSISSAVLRDAEGSIEAVMSIFSDVTERKRAEARLRESEEQLRQSQKMEAVGKLAGGIAHDFNNLLTAITGYSHLLLGGSEIPGPARAKVQEIAQAADRAAELTRQLLAFSRRQVLSPRVVDLGDVVLGIEPMLRRLIGEDVELVTVLPDSVKPVKADSGQLEQVLLNFAVNARDAMPRGGRLTIEAASIEVGAGEEIPPGVYSTLAVADTGAGMDAETRERVFEPFFTTKEVGKGTGLGLSMVYGIIAQSGGFVSVESELGAGTTFTVYLPRVRDVSVDPSEALQTQPRSASGSETVLLVENEESVRKFTQEVLERHGYAVLDASGPHEALAMSAKHTAPIHLLVTDVVMPGMSGLELAGLLRVPHPETKVLYISGYNDAAIAGYGVLELGTTLLEKPFSLTKLTETVRATLDRGVSAHA